MSWQSSSWLVSGVAVRFAIILVYNRKCGHCWYPHNQFCFFSRVESSLTPTTGYFSLVDNVIWTVITRLHTNLSDEAIRCGQAELCQRTRWQRKWREEKVFFGRFFSMSRKRKEKRKTFLSFRYVHKFECVSCFFFFFPFDSQLCPMDGRVSYSLFR